MPRNFDWDSVVGLTSKSNWARKMWCGGQKGAQLMRLSSITYLVRLKSWLLPSSCCSMVGLPHHIPASSTEGRHDSRTPTEKINTSTMRYREARGSTAKMHGPSVLRIAEFCLANAVEPCLDPESPRTRPRSGPFRGKWSRRLQQFRIGRLRDGAAHRLSTVRSTFSSPASFRVHYLPSLDIAR